MAKLRQSGRAARSNVHSDDCLYRELSGWGPWDEPYDGAWAKDSDYPRQGSISVSMTPALARPLGVPQTGFDRPLIHAMYVDRKLGGVNAVQSGPSQSAMAVPRIVGGIGRHARALRMGPREGRT
jgi:hypothetical protein